MQVPFVIYADFEAITEKIQGCNMNDQQSYTDKYQSILVAVMVIKLYVVVMIKIQDEYKPTREKIQ